MSWRRRSLPNLVPALLAAGVGLALLGGAVQQLVRPIEMPEGGNAQAGTTAMATAPGKPAVVASAVAANPFRPDRRPAPEPFRMPGEGVIATAAGQTLPGAIVLIGTAVLPNGGGFAMCQRGGEPPRLVRVGERFGGFTLRSVAQGRAVFRGESGEVVNVSVGKAGN